MDFLALCIQELANSMEDQVLEQIKLAKYFSWQLEKRTYVANIAVLLLYVQFKHNDMKEFFCIF